MRRLHHGGVGVAALALLVALSGTWWELTLPTGRTILVSGLEASALGSTLLGALAASYAAALLATGPVRRLLGLLQTGLGIGVMLAWGVVLRDPVSGQASAIAALTGLSGEGALSGVEASGPMALLWLGVAGAGLAAIAGVMGVLAPDPGPSRSRFDRREGAGSSDPIDTWDALSEGSDPTDR